MNYISHGVAKNQTRLSDFHLHFQFFFHERFEVLGYSSEKESQSPLAI